MSNSQVAKRYALALFQIAKNNNLLDAVGEDLRVVKEVMQSNPQLKSVLKTSKLSLDKKRELIKTAFASVNTYVLNTVLILIDRHRDDEIVEVANQFKELQYEVSGLAEADVHSIRPLTDAEKQAISTVFAAKVGKQHLEITNYVDSELLGGVRVRIRNRIYDGSLRGKLDRLERKLLS